MKISLNLKIGLTCAALATQAAWATELPDCGLDTSPAWGGARILERARPSADVATLLSVSGNLRNGTPLTFSRDDAVLVADLLVSNTRQTLIPAGDISVKSSWMLSFSYKFAALQPIPVYGEVKLEDGRKLLLIRSKEAQVLFLDEQGHFCNKALNATSRPHVWAAGTLSLESPETALESKVVEEKSKEGSLRIIFTGAGAGQLSFQEVWVHGPTIVSSQSRNFDQFAKRIKIGPFDFEVLEVADGKVTLRYDIPERSPARMADLARLPLRAVR